MLTVKQGSTEFFNCRTGFYADLLKDVSAFADTLGLHVSIVGKVYKFTDPYDGNDDVPCNEYIALRKDGKGLPAQAELDLLHAFCRGWVKGGRHIDFVFESEGAECPKGGTHFWGTDGHHSNLFCKKCYVDYPMKVEFVNRLGKTG